MRYSQPLSWARSRSLLGCCFLFWGREEEEKDERRGRSRFFVLLLRLLRRRRRSSISSSPRRATRVRSRASSRDSFAPQHRRSKYVCITMERERIGGSTMRRKAPRASDRHSFACARQERGVDEQQRLGCAAQARGGEARCGFSFPLAPSLPPSLAAAPEPTKPTRQESSAASASS